MGELTQQCGLSLGLLGELLERPLFVLLLGQNVEQVQVDACLGHRKWDMLRTISFICKKVLSPYAMVQPLSSVLSGLCAVQKLQCSIVEVFLG